MNNRDSYKGSRAAEKQRRAAWMSTALILVVLVVVAALTVVVIKMKDRIPASNEQKTPSQEEPSGIRELSKDEKDEKDAAASGWLVGYMAGEDSEIILENEAGEDTYAIIRGTKVEYTTAEDGRTKIRLGSYVGYCRAANVKSSLDEVVPEQTLYVRTPVNLRDEESHILEYMMEKGDTVAVVGYDYLEKDGAAHMYRVIVDGAEAYIKPWYVVNDYDDAVEVYDPQGSYLIHASRGNGYGGGDGGSLDYFPRDKANFEDNPMPEEVRALYLTYGDIALLDEYIEIIQGTGINAVVVNIADGGGLAYPAASAKIYSPASYASTRWTLEEFKAGIDRLKDLGYYMIGRITTFTDGNFAYDHPECTILDENGNRKFINGNYWPSGFSRLCWEYKVALAVDAVIDCGFNEIQFDYVRFPDLTQEYEAAGTIDFVNNYNETKAQAIQRFLMYACDVIHDYGAYVSADVFGECAYTYIAAYGQYWPSISNVVDVISGMPYPDHFGSAGGWRPWEHPYETILEWSNYAATRQSEIASPAIVRTWIQCYDAIRPPYNPYGVYEVSQEIQALRDVGFTAGYLTWNGVASRSKYRELREAFNY